MSVLYIALPLALLLGGGAMWACVVCIRNGQYEDLDTPAIRILVDERQADEPELSGTESNPYNPHRSDGNHRDPTQARGIHR